MYIRFSWCRYANAPMMCPRLKQMFKVHCGKGCTPWRRREASLSLENYNSTITRPASCACVCSTNEVFQRGSGRPRVCNLCCQPLGELNTRHGAAAVRRNLLISLMEDCSIVTFVSYMCCSHVWRRRARCNPEAGPRQAHASMHTASSASTCCALLMYGYLILACAGHCGVGDTRLGLHAISVLTHSRRRCNTFPATSPPMIEAISELVVWTIFCSAIDLCFLIGQGQP